MKSLRNTFRFLWWIFIFFLPLTLLAQEQEDFFPYSTIHYNSKQGLPQNQVLDFVEGNNGIYISTAGGITFFNGVNFAPFNLTKSAQMQRVLFRENDVLYGWSGVLQLHQFSDSLKSLGSYSAIGKKGDLWIGLKDDDKITTLPIGGTDGKTLLSLPQKLKSATQIEYYQNHYYIATETGLFSIHKEGNKLEQISSTETNKIKVNPFDKRLYFVGEGIHRLTQNKNSYTIETVCEPEKNVQCRDLVFLDTNTFISTSTSGLIFHENGKQIRPSPRSGLFNANLYNIYCYTPENAIFVGTENNGFYILSPIKVKTYFADKNENSTQSFNSIVKDENDVIYSSVTTGEIVAIDKHKKEVFYNFPKHISSLSYLDNNFYIGTWKSGMYQLRNNTLQPFSFMKKQYNIMGMMKDSQGNRWVSTSEGVYINRKNRTDFLPTEITGPIITSYELKNGDIVFGGVTKMYIFNPTNNTYSTINKDDGLECKEVRSFYEDEEENLWIATYGGGLYRYKHGKLKSINSISNCMLNKDIFTLAKHKNGMIYMSSNNGIWAIQENKLKDFADNKLDYLIPFYYGEEIGITNTEFNGGFQNNFALLNEFIYFPSIEGLVEFNTSIQVPQKKHHPKFTSIIYNDTIVAKSTVFPNHTHTLSFEFHTTSIKEEYNLFYQYQLVEKGSIGKWSTIQKEGKIDFKLLKAGEYSLNIRALDGFNDPEPVILSYSFKISPYFYKTWWFLAGIMAILIIVVIYIFKVREHTQKRFNQIKDALHSLKLESIQYKMNPHFMYNTLNSAIYFLNIEEYEKAEAQIEDFSRLLRWYLDNADDVFISIHEEVEMMDLYLKIQQKRYNFEFDYHINFDKKIRETLIPSMILQPLVENAIIHGLAHKDTKGYLKISLIKKVPYIYVKIEDNGVGRERSLEINKSLNKPSSRGMALVKEKAKVIQSQYGLSLEMKITDIKEGDKTGTIIDLKLPIYDD